MIKAFKANQMLVILIIIISILVCGQLFMTKEEERTKRIVVESEFQSLLGDKKVLEHDLQKALKETEALKLKLEDVQLRAELLASNFEEEKRAKETALATLEEQRSRSASLEKTLEGERKSKLALAQDLKAVEEQYAKLRSQLARIQAEKESLELMAKKPKPSSGPIELKKIVVKPGETSQGEVLVVNKEFNFVVTSLGQEDGLRPDTILTIYRDDRPLTEAKIEKLYSNLSIAGLEEPLSLEIKKGDKVKVSQKD